MNARILFPLALALVAPVTSAAAEYSRAEGACTDGESWKLGPELAPADAADWNQQVLPVLSRKQAPVMAFAEAMALRRKSGSAEARLLGEYFVSRSLFGAKLTHIAFQGFATVAGYPLTAETAGVQTAALECLNQIHRRYPTLGLPLAVRGRLADYLAKAPEGPAREVVREAVISHLHELLSEDAAESELTRAAALLRGGGAFESFGAGILAAHRGEHRQVIENLEAVFALPSLPKALRGFADPAHLTLARSYYATGHFDAASAQLKLVKKSSNELAEALSELSWSYLLSERYPEAIGTAMNLDTGGLRHTFAPEAPMVMAMSLNELCQYPESVRAVYVFRRNYEKPYRWLDAWNSEGGSRKLYPLAVQFLRRQRSAEEAPERVASEWVRSPVFISHQDELNLIYDENEGTTALGRAGAREQKRIATQIRALAAALKPRIQSARAGAKPGDPLPKHVLADLATLKSQVIRFRRMRAAAPAWRAILDTHQRRIPKVEQRLVAGINADLQRRSRTMLRQLEEIAENNQLIEVEIYNGASQDIIWQNAHPDYKDLARQLKDEQRRASAEKVWDWGRAPAGTADEAGEIWEDELGSFKADLYDNCSSKDRYLALRHKEGST